jgi:hypothetical protein
MCRCDDDRERRENSETIPVLLLYAATSATVLYTNNNDAKKVPTIDKEYFWPVELVVSTVAEGRPCLNVASLRSRWHTKNKVFWVVHSLRNLDSRRCWYFAVHHSFDQYTERHILTKSCDSSEIRDSLNRSDQVRLGQTMQLFIFLSFFVALVVSSMDYEHQGDALDPWHSTAMHK